MQRLLPVLSGILSRASTLPPLDQARVGHLERIRLPAQRCTANPFEPDASLHSGCRV